MLKRKYRLAKKNDFKMVFNKGHSFFAKSINIIVLKDKDLDFFKVGFIVSNKVSKKAVLRNKVKRRLRACVRELFPKFNGGGYIIIIAKKVILDYDYNKIKQDLIYLFNKSGIL